ITHIGETLTWHALDSRLWDVRLFNFAQSRGKRTYGVVFWAVTVIDSPREVTDVRLAVGSNSASRWWLNGEVAAELFDDRRMVMDDVLSDRLTLRKGRNVIHGAIINGPGLSDFCLRLLDASGQPLRAVEVVVRGGAPRSTRRSPPWPPRPSRVPRPRPHSSRAMSSSTTRRPSSSRTASGTPSARAAAGWSPRMAGPGRAAPSAPAAEWRPT